MPSLLAIVSFAAGVFLAATDLSPEEANIARLTAEVARQPDNLDTLYLLGLAYNDYALLDSEDSNEAALERAIETFEEVYERDPSRLTAKAMLGSSTVLKARFVSLFSKGRWAKKGFLILDETIEEEPDNPYLRLIRAANSSKVPGFMGRGDEASEDFAWLLQAMESQPNHYDADLRRSAYFYAGEYALKKDDESAIKLLLQAQAVPGTDARLDHQIAETLAKARKTFPDSEYAKSEL